jgi:phage-related baseplate assembly protein
MTQFGTTEFGLTGAGFVLKPVDVILSESFDRARAAFGGDVDLGSTSPLRKVLETTAAEDGELWKRLEDLYYGNFVSTAVGDNLDLLGEDVGLPRPELPATGTVTVTLREAAPGRRYLLPAGAVLVTATQVAFGTVEPVTLDSQNTTATVGVTAFEPGPGGDLDSGAIVTVDPTYQGIFLADFAPAEIAVTNPQPITGGTDQEPDETYRNRLLGLTRNLWTPDAIAQAALSVTGVLDVVLADPLGGLDVSQSFFNLFKFGQRAFSGERRIGEPYLFDVVVAHDPRAPWHPIGPVVGVFERVSAAVDRVRPIGVHANILEATSVEVGVRATVVVQPGSDGPALLSSVRQRLAGDVGGLRLGGDVLHSQVVRAFVEQPGVLDVQNVHLRRLPGTTAGAGTVPGQDVLVEAGVGENLAMGPTELALFPAGGALFDVSVVTR